MVTTFFLYYTITLGTFKGKSRPVGAKSHYLHYLYCELNDLNVEKILAQRCLEPQATCSLGTLPWKPHTSQDEIFLCILLCLNISDFLFMCICTGVSKNSRSSAEYMQKESRSSLIWPYPIVV